MSYYTTGEVAKLCDITVRTVQYYDNRGILIPSQLSEGGRRLYSEEDLQRMKAICFLRELGLSINLIAQLLAEEHPERVIDLLLQQRETELTEMLRENKTQLEKITNLRSGLKQVSSFQVESITDIAAIMENKKKLKKVRWTMALSAVGAELVELGTLVLALTTGIWWPFFAVGLPVIIAFSVWFSWYYFTRVAYVCPQCQTTFSPKFAEAFFANHTPTTRKLTCSHCGHKGFCVEVYNENR